ncbi:putative major facilitator, sugar transporter, major facilitator superfamily [Helianthus annuus]|nr:putative major facilitator, sugar transporter, major facilitator superfamily [Helianthus annuus]KAJ0562434.1 putative major facilitator, sugar transporter, major facilitator superfamily [Helianthus annuus]KAJ0727809.1 putative major facilitator, sugar transporter, major facilitator superfamily [Helianthus annuus]KAJ0730600.1 putative major facilitator, sugar transporter, major facilitator superfamily [Helianthus annuus]
MASTTPSDHDDDHHTFSSIGKAGKSSGEIEGMDVRLLNNYHQPEKYSVLAAILPFLFPAFGGLLYGYDIGATSSATINIKSPTFSGISWYDLSSVQVGLITSGSLYGALIGSLLAFNVADFLGRRRELMVSAASYIIGAVITTLAPGFAIMVVGRFIYGIGIGLAMHAAPMYIAETAASQIRGRLISLKEFFIVMGMVLGYVVGSLLVELYSGWRYMYATAIPFAVVMGIGMWWLPASPRWILLRAIQGKATQEVEDILAELSYISEEGEATLGEMFQGKCLKALIIGAGLVLFQQITGQPSVLYYAASIFQTAGFSAASDATRASIFLGLLKLVMTGVAVLVVDKLGRRPLLLGGVSGIAIALFLMGSFYSYLSGVPAVAVVALLVYVGCYQISFGPIGWLMISEIFPLRLRGRGLSIAVLVNFGANALVAFAFSPLQTLLGAGPLFFIFGGIAVASLVFIFFIVPETKGLTLEEIEAKLL